MSETKKKSIEDQKEELMEIVSKIEDVGVLKDIYEEMCSYLKKKGKKKSFRIIQPEEKK